MPRILEYPAARRVVKFSFQQPFSKLDIVLLRSLPDCFPCDRELSTAVDPHDCWDRLARKKLFKRFLIRTAGSFSLSRVRQVVKRPDFSRTSQNPDAAQVDITFFAKIRELEAAKHSIPVIVWIVIMPLPTFGMKEKNKVREAIVVVNDITGQR